MAFLNDVGGKINSKTYTIGDGVDKVHSPLQVLPYMATDMLNLTSNKFPSLSVRNGRTSLFDQTRLSVLNTERFISMCLPFMDSAGNIHYAYLQFKADRTGVSFKGCDLMYYIKKPTDNVPVFRYYYNIGFDAIPSPLDRESYATGNFCEYQSHVYFSFSRGTSGAHYIYVTKWSIATSLFVSGATVADFGSASSRMVPTCIYLDKLFVGFDMTLTYSATGVPTDFTTTQDSGSIPLSQGGMITSLTPMRDRMIISTEKAIFLLFGTGFDSFSISLLADNMGIDNPKCITQKNGIVYFSATDGETYEYNGSKLLNITREPIDTGSKSYVKGGFPYSEFIITSLAIKENQLYCVDDRTSYKKMYVFDITKRRWYIQDYPYSDTTLANFYNVLFEGDNELYSLITKTSTVGTMEQVVNTLYLVDNGTLTDIETVVDAAGTKQKETNTVVGTVTTAGNITVTITHPFYYASPDASSVAVALNDTAAQVAAKIKAAFDNVTLFPKFNEYFTMTVSSANVIVECKIPLANESTFNINIKNDDSVGITETDSANTTAGVAATYKTVTTASVAPFKWISPAYQLTPTGKQMLKAIHFSYYSPSGTELSVYTSNTLDQDDFVKIRTLPISSLNQSGKFVLPVASNAKNDWLRIKLEGTGNVTIYNMTMDWRILEKVR